MITEPGFSTLEVTKTLTSDWNEYWNCETTLHRWRRSGAITPSLQTPDGSGTRARWSVEDLTRIVQIWVIRSQLASYGIQITSRLVKEIWDTLVDGREWKLCLEAVPGRSDERDT